MEESRHTIVSDAQGLVCRFSLMVSQGVFLVVFIRDKLKNVKYKSVIFASLRAKVHWRRNL